MIECISFASSGTCSRIAWAKCYAAEGIVATRLKRKKPMIFGVVDSGLTDELKFDPSMVDPNGLSSPPIDPLFRSVATCQAPFD